MARQGMLFVASVGFQGSFTSLANFSWGSAAALWNFRWQVEGFRGAVDGVNQGDLADRFLSGSGIDSWNVRPGFLQQGWEDDQQQLARSMLGSRRCTAGS